jgi:glucokinase
MDKIVLAVDLGGTNLRMAAVGAGGEVVARSKSATPRSDDPRDIVDAIIASARDCHDPGAPEYDIQAIGIAIPAMSIGAGGVVNKAANLPSLDGFALAPAVAEKLGVPAVLENDANAAAIGENWIGASRGIQNSICVTLGTGVGGGIILNGATLRGPDWSAGEIGHICVEPLGPPCGCGSNGCVEQYSSATAIVRMAREIMGNYPASELHGKFELSAFDVYEAGKSGDELAGEVFRLMGQYLGIALAGLINVLNPEVIVIGGGVAAGWDLFIGHVRDEIEKRAYCEPAKRAKLVRALLGDDAGILGAARVAFGSGK